MRRGGMPRGSSMSMSGALGSLPQPLVPIGYGRVQSQGALIILHRFVALTCIVIDQAAVEESKGVVGIDSFSLVQGVQGFGPPAGSAVGLPDLRVNMGGGRQCGRQIGRAS